MKLSFYGLFGQRWAFVMPLSDIVPASLSQTGDNLYFKLKNRWEHFFSKFNVARSLYYFVNLASGDAKDLQMLKTVLSGRTPSVERFKELERNKGFY